MTIYSDIVLLGTTIGMIIWLSFVIRDKKSWYLAIGPITYFGSIFLFYAAKFTNTQTPIEMNVWSNVIRLESIFLFIILGIILLKRGPNKWI
jgi:hypothetical protein